MILAKFNKVGVGWCCNVVDHYHQSFHDEQFAPLGGGKAHATLDLDELTYAQKYFNLIWVKLILNSLYFYKSFNLIYFN